MTSQTDIYSAEDRAALSKAMESLAKNIAYARRERNGGKGEYDLIGVGVLEDSDTVKHIFGTPAQEGQLGADFANIKKMYQDWQNGTAKSIAPLRYELEAFQNKYGAVCGNDITDFIDDAMGAAKKMQATDLKVAQAGKDIRDAAKAPGQKMADRIDALGLGDLGTHHTSDGNQAVDIAGEIAACLHTANDAIHPAPHDIPDVKGGRESLTEARHLIGQIPPEKLVELSVMQMKELQSIITGLEEDANTAGRIHASASIPVSRNAPRLG